MHIKAEQRSTENARILETCFMTIKQHKKFNIKIEFMIFNELLHSQFCSPFFASLHYFIYVNTLVERASEQMKDVENLLD